MSAHQRPMTRVGHVRELLRPLWGILRRPGSRRGLCLRTFPSTSSPRAMDRRNGAGRDTHVFPATPASFLVGADRVRMPKADLPSPTPWRHLFPGG